MPTTAVPPLTGSPSKDYQPWQWGGNLVVYEIVQETDGSLAVRLPETVAGAFATGENAVFVAGLGRWSQQDGMLRIEATGRYGCASAGSLAETCLIEPTLRFSAGMKALGLMLRTGADFETGYYVRLEPQLGRLIFDAWPRAGDVPLMVELERPLSLAVERPVQVALYVNGSICEVYVDERVAMSARMYDHATGEWGVFAVDGMLEASRVRVHRLD